MGVVLRRVNDIKTHAGGVGASTKSKSRGAIFIKIAMLELERDRRTKERQVTAARVQQIETRLQEIEAEVTALYAASSGVIGPRPSASVAGTETPTATRRRVLRF
jgi:hypothetical protein